MRAQKYVVLPDEDGAEFAALEAALVAELAPVGTLQVVLARRVAVAAWRLERADCIEAELFAERGYDAAGPGLALIRDGNGTRSFETLLRYRGAAMAEFWRALRTLKALQAEQAARELHDGAPVRAQPPRAVAHPDTTNAPGPNQPERRAESPPGPQLQYVLPDPPGPGRTLHEPAARWTPNEPEPAPAIRPAPALPAAQHERAAGRAHAGGRRTAPGR